MPETTQPLVEGLRALAAFVVGEAPVDEVLLRVTHVARSAVAPCDIAGITCRENGELVTVVATDPVAPIIDEAQYGPSGGPCVMALGTGQVLRIDSTEEDERWPAFAEAAAAHGVRSTLSLPMMVKTEPVGALNLYSRTVAAFTPAEEEVGRALADQAAAVLANALAYRKLAARADQLEQALESRAVIDQAKGILMARHHCQADHAFRLLVAASQHRNVKLRDVATEVIEAVSRPTPAGSAGSPSGDLAAD